MKRRRSDENKDSDNRRIFIPFPKSLLLIGNKYRGEQVSKKGKSLLIELNNNLPLKSVNPSA